jgi:LmbE family N-acetylglucosaminyl deacetylase
MSVLVIAPHMDDEVLGCGGLLQRFERAEVVFVTEAEADVRIDHLGEEVEYDGARRVEEMESVAAMLGFSATRLRFPLHKLDTCPTADVLAGLAAHLRGVDLILSPARSHDQDHEAVRRAVDALVRPQHYAGSVLEYLTWGCPATTEPVVVLPLADVEMDRKLAALARYATQVEPRGTYDESYPYAPDSAAAFAKAAGRLAHSDQAEAFLPRRLVPNATTARLFGD